MVYDAQGREAHGKDGGDRGGGRAADTGQDKIKYHGMTLLHQLPKSLCQ